MGSEGRIRTINRAKAGVKSWDADGTVFKNLLGDLPGGKYTEWTVHFGETCWATALRGWRRIVLGSDGSVWYTINHYGDEFAQKVVGGPPFYQLWWR